MTPIEKIVIFGVHTQEQDFTIVEVTGSGGLSEVSSTEFASRKEALAYAERISVYYGVEITDLGLAE